MIDLLALIISLVGSIIKEYFKYKEIADAENKQYKIDRARFTEITQTVLTKMKKELQEDSVMPIDDFLDNLNNKDKKD